MHRFDRVGFFRTDKVSRNRIALAPLTNMQSNSDGTLGDDEYRWLLRRAEGGFGLIITCATYVSDDGKGWSGELGISQDIHLEGLTKLAAGLHEKGSLCVVQLFHGGGRAPEDIIGQIPWSASAYTIPSTPARQVREATEEDIHRVIAEFGKAAARAANAGFDGVELHGAHAYLLHQFLSTTTNTRKDAWGGSYAHRKQLTFNIFQEVKKSVPENFIVGIRLSPEDRGTFQGIDFDESIRLAGELCNAGIDYIHVSIWEAFKKPEKYPQSSQTIIEHFRAVIPHNIPMIVAGGIWTPADAEKAFSLGADMVALGQAAIGNPDWPLLSVNENYEPSRPPYTTAFLAKAGLGKAFLAYMQKWKGFIKAG